MSYTISPRDLNSNAGIVVIGCGGTGGFVAEGLCRLLANQSRTLLLIDHDRVEPHNLRRQNFHEQDVGKFKSQALAERLSRLYGKEILYSVYPYSKEMITEAFGRRYSRSGLDGIIIGCVDNAKAREAIAESARGWSWWIDAGNSEHSGQVLIGNTRDPEVLKGSFYEGSRSVTRLPLPTVQQPGLLIPPTQPVKRDLSCAEAVEANFQSPVINQMMAALVLLFVSRLLEGKLTWMALYIDLDSGSLRPIPTDPETVARMVGVRVDQLVANKTHGEADRDLGKPPLCPNCGRRHW